MTTRALRSLRAFAFAALSALALPAFAAPPAQLLAAPRGPVNDHVPDFVRSGANAVRFNSDEMLNLSPGQEVELTLPNARKHAFVFELREAHGNGIYSWIGYHKDRGNNNRAIVTTGPSGSFGVFYTPEGEYRLIPGEGHDWLVDMTAEAPFIPPLNLGDDGIVAPVQKSVSHATYAPETMVRIPGVNSVAVTKSTPVPQYVVDLMIVYTTGLAQNLGANLMTRLYFLVTRANTAYADSEVAITLRLVKAVQVNYSDATSDSVALGAIAPSEPTFDAANFGLIEALRAAAGADLVSFLRNGASFGGSGLAYVGNTTPNTSMPTYMYSAIQGCVLACESVFIHELGHNMGNMHDRATVSWQAGGVASPPTGAYSYSFGYAFCKSGTLTCNPNIPNGNLGGCGSSQPECSTTDNSNFGDIMAYFQGTAQTVYKFSNPNVMCATANGDLTPRPCGVSEITQPTTSANTALSMNNNRAALSAIKSAVTGTNAPGSLQFTSTAVTAVETAGTMTFNVSRLGGSSGAVGATYTTTNGTAVAGVDYVASSGNVSWADGDTANKPISVTLIANGANAVSPRFTIGLSSPTGPAGVTIGFPSTATGIITEPWPPNGAMPAGFLTPDGSNGAWTVATDQVYEGTTSLRSAQVYGTLNPDFTPATYATSDLSYFNASFGGGQLSFAYRVSSFFANYAFFEFSVDGSVVLSESGESGWKIFNYPLTAGAHTLRWRFRNAIPSWAPCNDPGWTPQAPGGASCADRAWIDALILPLNVPNLLSVKSRKTHAAGGTFDITVDPTQPIASAVTVEARQIASGHKVVFQFDTAITSTGTVSCVDAASNPVGSISSAIVGNTVEVTLTAIPENKRVKVSLANVNASGVGASASLGFLSGDLNGSRSVTSADILAAKGRSGLTFGTTNWPYDVNLTGTLDASDVSAVKASAGLSLP